MNSSMALNGTKMAANLTDLTVTSAQRMTYAVSATVAIIAIITFIYNLLIITTFIRDHHIRTPFNYYLLNLSISDTCMAAFEMTLFVAYALAGSWKYGRRFCTLFIWINWTFSAAAANSVMLICLDRIWALFWPISYRNHRSNKMTFIICVCNWIYIQAGLIPLITLDRAYYAYDDSVCLLNLQAQQTYVMVLLFLLYYCPLIVVVVGYIAAVAEVVRRSKKKQVVHVSKISETSNGKPTRTADTGPISVNGAQTKQIDKLDKRMYMTLSFLALSLIVLWTPASVYFFISTAWDGYFNLEYYMVATALEFASCAVNPIVYHFGISSIRKAMQRQFCSA